MLRGVCEQWKKNVNYYEHYKSPRTKFNAKEKDM